MATTVDDMLNRFLQFDAIQAGKETMQANSSRVLDKNRKQLYEEGVDSTGQRLPSYAGALGGGSIATSYFAQKKARNPRVGSNNSYDMYDTGATFRSLTLEFSGAEYSIIPKTAYAYEPAGYLPYGITIKSASEMWPEFMQDGVVDKLAAATGCTKR